MVKVKRVEGWMESIHSGENIFQDLDDVRTWLRELQASKLYKVDQIDLEDLEDWFVEEKTQNICHKSGKYFKIEGLRCSSKADNLSWFQPIINQPEVGLLGILSKVFGGTRYFLMQAKMEPGNVNKVQLSPTLQATHSNYSQVHKGKLPDYLEYFLDGSSEIINDQLQSETGTRFFQKFNRNILLNVIDEVQVFENFKWLTLSEIQILMLEDDVVNMDARSVLSNIDFGRLLGDEIYSMGDLFSSVGMLNSDSEKRLKELRGWLSRSRRIYHLEIDRIPLIEVEGWILHRDKISHNKKNYFSVVGVKVEAHDREVSNWSQPILKHEGLGLAGFICSRINGVLHFLIQAKPEPGIVNSVELAPTVSLFDFENRVENYSSIPLVNMFLKSDNVDKTIMSVIQSEEGGRFWNLRNRFIVIEVEDRKKLEFSEKRHQWLTLGELFALSQSPAVVTSECRTLLSSIYK